MIPRIKIGTTASGRKPFSYDLRKPGMLSRDIAKMNTSRNNATPKEWMKIDLWVFRIPHAASSATNPNIPNPVTKNGI